MKTLSLIVIATFYLSATYAQVGINADNSAPHASAMLDVKSTTKAFYPPRMNTTDKNGIVGKQAGAVVFDITLNQLSYYNGSAWVATAGGGLTLPFEQSQSYNGSLLKIENTEQPSTSSNTIAISASVTGNSGTAIYGKATNLNPSSHTFPFYGRNYSTNAFGYGILGQHDGSGTGVAGISNSGIGIRGGSTSGIGVSGNSINGIGANFSSSNSHALITGTGNVGIGVTDPLTILDVKSRMRVRHDTETSGIYFDNSSHIIKSFVGMRNDNHVGLYGSNGAGWAFNMNLTNGNVGIGNDAPQEKLHITAGNIRVDALASSGYNQLYTNSQGNIQNVAPIAFLVKSLVNLSNIPISDDFLVPFNTAEYNLGGFYNTSNYEFTAPVNGIYHFDAFVTFGPIGSVSEFSMYTLSLFKNDVAYSAVKSPMVSANSQKTMNLSQDISLNAGQKVKIAANQTSNTVVSFISGDYLSKFSGHLVMRL